MEWIVKIEKTPDVENEIQQRIKVIFAPMGEEIWVHGEAKLKQNKWTVFSAEHHNMEISLSVLQELMEKCVVSMRKRLKEYENLDKGFSVLKWVGFEEDTTDDSQPLV